MTQATNLTSGVPQSAPFATTDVAALLQALVTQHRGASRPGVVTGEDEGLWLKTVSSTAWELYYYDGSSDVLIGTINPTAHTWAPAGTYTDLTLTGDLTIAQTVSFTGVLSPSQITSDQNNYAPTGHADASVFRLSTDALRTLTGLAGGAAGRTVEVHNVGSRGLLLTSEDTASSAANRFSLSGDLLLRSGEAARLYYDGVSSRWRRVGSSNLILVSGGAGDDTTRIVNALADLPGGKGTVLLVDRAYTVSSTITVGDGQGVAGMGDQHTVVTATAGNPVFFLNDGAGAFLRDFELTGTADVGISVYGGDECMIDRVYVEGTGSGTIDVGIEMYDASGLTTCYANRIFNCKINQCGTTLLRFTGNALASSASVVNCNLGGNLVTTNGIQVTDFGLFMRGVDILATTGDGVVGTSITSAAQVFSATDCGADSCGGNGFSLTDWGNIKLDGCWLSANGGSGIRIVDSNNITLTGNRSHYNEGEGILVSGGLNVELTGNHTVNNDTTNLGIPGISLSDTDHVTLTGNLSRNYTDAIAGHQPYGLALSSGCTEIRLSGNDFAGNGVAPIHSDGTCSEIKGIVHESYTVSNLNTHLPPDDCSGLRAFVSDASSPTFGNTVSGGGAVPIPVYSDWAAWKAG